MVQESAQYAATRQKVSEPGPVQLVILWCIAAVATLLALALSAASVDGAQTAVHRIGVGLSADVNPWPAILAGPLYMLGVMSAVAAIVLSAVREMHRR